MPRQPAQPDPQYLDERHQRIVEFGAEFFDDDEERENFIDTLMERGGYTRTASWAPPPEPPQGGTAGGTRPQAPRRPAYFRK